MAQVVPADQCTFNGNMTHSFRRPGGPQHTPVTPNADPSHSHFKLDGALNCNLAGPYKVSAFGGEDGHVDDNGGGPNGDPIEMDPWDDQVPGEIDFTLGGGNPDGDDHDYNDHHGWVAESGWSHSDQYSGGADDLNGILAEWNDPQAGYPAPGPSTCAQIGIAPTDPLANQNRTDITAVDISGVASQGWFKYYRLGAIMVVWGCFYDGPLSAQWGGPNPYFSGKLLQTAGATTLSGPVQLGPWWQSDGVIDGNS